MIVVNRFFYLPEMAYMDVSTLCPAAKNTMVEKQEERNYKTDFAS